MLVFVSVFRGAKLEEKTVQCKSYGYWDFDDGGRWYAGCRFNLVMFNRDTKLNIERDGIPAVTDEDFGEITFSESLVPVLHPDILKKFPNIYALSLGVHSTKLEGLDSPYIIENCGNLTSLELYFDDFVEISSDIFTDCKKLKTLEIRSDSLTDLPNNLFENQATLRSLVLWGNKKNLKLRVSSFESLKSLSELRLQWMDLSKMEENFFQSLKIKTLDYEGNPSHEFTFPIESLNSQETIEELTIRETNLSEIPETIVPTLRSMKQLKIFSLPHNSIRSVEAFVDLPNVERIDLGHNAIEELPANAFKGCPRLASLDLSWNPIKVLRGHEFNQLSGLKELVLSHNHIQEIHPEAFNNLHSLTRLELQGNKCVDENIFTSSGDILNMTLVNEKLKDCLKKNHQPRFTIRFHAVFNVSGLFKQPT